MVEPIEYNACIAFGTALAAALFVFELGVFPAWGVVVSVYLCSVCSGWLQYNSSP